ncbi:uncharacterized protein YeaO (DUF488 family) [Pseudoclavibacter chungangensis]|uniref:DUF488 domain-containing protein n=1 Tax=Pseudoclavibacter chungangensis TaxID=587635 RepID=UPI0015CBBD33|nr:DUF488 family protein [Pseudoclavibacter chungangensis]NYJ68278.1 uncharacterized protein YeaO (DUF488 family) [Pseudoclavibacter chungangensis]
MADDDNGTSPTRHDDAILLKRAYADPAPADGFRVLVDRLWPRGLSKERADIDLRLPHVAPSPELRTWWGHDPDRFDEFAHRYRAELATNPALDELLAVVREHPVVTLVYAAHDPHVNHAVVLRDVVLEHLSEDAAGRRT